MVIGTPPYLHAEVTARALERGKHVFCEARMANELDAGLRVLAADRQSQMTTMLCPAPHYMSVDRHIRGLLSDGHIGQVRHVVVEHAGGVVADPEAPLHWRQRSDLNGINALDIGIVAEVLLRWFGPIVKSPRCSRRGRRIGVRTPMGERWWRIRMLSASSVLSPVEPL